MPPLEAGNKQWFSEHSGLLFLLAHPIRQTHSLGMSKLGVAAGCIAPLANSLCPFLTALQPNRAYSILKVAG